MSVIFRQPEAIDRHQFYSFSVNLMAIGLLLPRV
jgi:hypothetical protein